MVSNMAHFIPYFYTVFPVIVLQNESFSELVDHKLWWKESDWLRFPSRWQEKSKFHCPFAPEEKKHESLHTRSVNEACPLVPLGRYSN